MLYHICISSSYNVSLSQVKDKKQEMKNKLRPHNAFLRAKDLDLPASVPRQELHRFLIGLHGEYVLPSSSYLHTQILRALELYKSPDSPLVSDAMLRRIWTRLRDRLSSLDSSSSRVEVTPASATHFIGVCVDKQAGKHIPGDRVRILLPTLPFLLWDLIVLEVQQNENHFQQNDFQQNDSAK